MDEERELEYLRVFHSIIVDGILFGMTTVGEMWVNEWRILNDWGNTEKLIRNSRRFFNEIYESCNAPITEEIPDPEKVKEWIKTLYEDSSNIFKDEFIETMLWAYDYKEFDIRIANIKTGDVNIGDEGVFLIDRRTSLGNPFILTDESQRDEVCDKYEEWFYSTGLKDHDVNLYLQKIKDYLIEYKRITLLCWCAPKRCHGETIKKWLEEQWIQCY